MEPLTSTQHAVLAMDAYYRGHSSDTIPNFTSPSRVSRAL